MGASFLRRSLTHDTRKFLLSETLAPRLGLGIRFESTMHN